MDPGSTEGLSSSFQDTREQGCVACPRALVYLFTYVERRRAVGREVRLIEAQLMGDARARGWDGGKS